MSGQAAGVGPCAPMQAGLVYETLSRGPDVYVQQVTVFLAHPLSAAELRGAWARVIARHEILRAEFALSPGRTPGLRVRAACTIAVAEHDWRRLAGIEGRWQALIDADRAAGVALDTAPLMRAALCRVSDHETRMLWTYHHALLDGRSRVRVLHELLGTPAPPPGPAPSFGAYAAWAHARATPPEARRFWRRLLAGIETPTPPPPSLRPGGPPSWAGRRLSRRSSDRLRGLAAERGLSLGAVVGAAFAVLLGQEAGTDDLLYASTRAGRRGPPMPVEEMVGLLMLTVPVRLRLERDGPFCAVAHALATLARETRPFEHTPLVAIQRESEIPAGRPLAETMFSFEERTTGGALAALDAAWAGRRVEVIERPGYGLMLKAYGDPEIALTAHWDGVRCPAVAGRRFLDRFADLLDELAASGLERPVGLLAGLGEARRRELSGEDEPVGAAGPGALVPHRIAAIVDAHPDRIAVSHRGTRMTYGELGRRSGAIAARLAALGVGPGDRVGIAAARTPDTIAALVGVHRRGAAYVPIDPGYPSARVTLMIADAGLSALVTDRPSAARLPSSELPRLVLDDRADAPAIADHPTAGADVSHVIYTSGTSGQPNGVVIGHDALAALTGWASVAFTAADRDGVLASTSLSFDLSVFEILVTLALGGRVVLVEDLSEVVRPGFSERVAHVNTVPSLASSLLARRDLPAGVRVVTFAGELLPPELVRRVSAAPGAPRVWNLYGPSEATTYATAALCEPQADGPIPIGRPLPGTHAFVLDRGLRPVPVGVRGELFLGGAGLARGYLGRPELTAERFVANPFGSSERLYRTGDLAAWAEDGSLEFHGRRDDQLKINGVRLEPAEVRRALLADPRVGDAAVVLGRSGAGLLGYVAVRDGARVDPGELRRELASRLPAHAVPARIVVLDSLPVTANGKLDRRALPEPSAAPASPVATPPLARELARMWQELLGLDARPGPEDDFFAVGGDSLDLLSLTVMIEDRWGVRISTAAMLRASALGAMAAAIEVDRAPASEHVAPLSAGGTRTPWFCVVARHEMTLGLRRELPRVMPDRPAYSLAVLPPSSVPPTPLDVGALATVALEHLVAAAPEGPYLLGGYSLGGAVAWEMACRLRAAGREVPLVTVLDTRAPHRQRGWGEVAARHRALGRRRRLARVRGYAGMLRSPVVRAAGAVRARVAPSTWALGSEVTAADVAALVIAYRPPSYDGAVLVFHTDEAAFEVGSPGLGWERHARGPLATRRVAGEHAGIISAAHAPAVAADLRDALDLTGA